MDPQIVKCLSAFLDFCYLVRRSEIGESDLITIEKALNAFYAAREIFRTSGVRPRGFNLPRQHSIVHYVRLIQEFGAPNGLCSSITESRHITAVKKPWRRSNHYEPLGQILLTNQRLDKLVSARVYFIARGMLPEERTKTPKPKPVGNDEEDDGAVDGDVLGEVALAIHARKSCLPRALTSLVETDIWTHSQSMDTPLISHRSLNTSTRPTCRSLCRNSSLTNSTPNLLRQSSTRQTR